MNIRPFTVLLFVIASTAAAIDIEPARKQLIDDLRVNMANGQVTHSVNTLSIGGSMGLSHSVSIDANEFAYQNYKGFRDKYAGRANNVLLSTSVNYFPQEVLRVFDFEDTVDFGYYIGSTLQINGWISSGYNYKSIGDERHTLDYDVDYLYWTKPNGTVVRFARTASPQYAASSATLLDITYPSGFKITVYGGGRNVLSNTGFQLKGIYLPDNRPLDKQDITTLLNVPAADSANWAAINPKHVQGINRAIEYCDALATDCALSYAWPTATFNWPAGMPRTMFIGNSNASVQDAAGRTTTYAYRSYDLAYVELQGGAIAMGATLWQNMSPRLVGVSSSSSREQYSYDYKNVWASFANDFGAWDLRLRSSGVVYTATRHTLPSTFTYNSYYTMNAAVMGDDVLNTGGGQVPEVRVHGHVNGTLGALYYAHVSDGRIEYEESARNFPTTFIPGASGAPVLVAPSETYTYTRGNLTRITYQIGKPESTYIEATFPAFCTSTTRKTCNQATSIRDARGKYTYYTYHADSGQVESIKPPANKNGIHSEKRFEYQQKNAYFYTGPSTKSYGTPIWLKTAERHCINSNYTSASLAATCSAGDEVITRFEYNHDNLLLTGMTVTDHQGNTLRTCYRYDRYGNQIGVTQPKANLSSCS